MTGVSGVRKRCGVGRGGGCGPQRRRGGMAGKNRAKGRAGKKCAKQKHYSVGGKSAAGGIPLLLE